MMKVKCPRCGMKEEVINNKCPICDLPLDSSPSKPVNIKIYKIAIPILAVIVIGLAYLYWSNHSITQAGKDAYKALKKIDALTSSGVNYQNYSDAVSNATLEYEMYADGKGRKNKNFLNILGKALTAYQYSKDIWHREIYSNVVNITDESFLSKQELDKYTELFPVLYEQEKKDEKFMDEKQSGFARVFVGKEYSTLMRLSAKWALWREASKELKKAGSLID